MAKLNSVDKVRCDNYFDNLINEGVSSCFSIAVSVKGKLAYTYCKGNESADKASSPLTPETRFNIASVTKPVTAFFAMKLVEEGLICLNDNVKKHIPEYPFEETTIMNLITHSAGYDPYARILPKSKREDHHEYFQLLYQITELKNEIGKVSEYWSPGYSILTDIIERVSGKGLEELAREVLFDPLEMDLSTYELSNLERENYFALWNSKSAQLTEDFHHKNITGDSGLYTTATDLIKFTDMILAGGTYMDKQIISRATSDRMLTESTGGKFNMSPIFWTRGDLNPQGCFGDLNSSRTCGHTGMSGCMMFVDPAYDLSGVILTNSIIMHEDWKNYKKICNLLTALATSR